jgi:hypothetical protein
LKQFSTPEEVRTVVSSGFPIRASVVLKGEIESIAILISEYVAANRSEEALLAVVTFFEGLSQNLPSVCKNVPTPEQRGLVRGDWLKGVPLTRIIEKSKDAVEITTDFYGYGLPWILHAAGQQLRCRGNSDAADELDKIGLLVELGLPSTAAAKVFLCGIRSRRAATQIASCLRNVDSISIRILRLFLVEENTRNRLKASVDAAAQEWLDILRVEEAAAQVRPHEIQDFSFETPFPTDSLHVRRFGEQLYLCSPDYSVAQGVQSDANFPFALIAEDQRYVFQNSQESPGVWKLAVRDPKLKPQTRPSELDLLLF